MNLGLLVLRIVVGLLFFGHGAQKLFGWFGGYGLEGTGGFFEGLGFRPGKRHAFLAGLFEAGGGLLLALGLLTPFAAFAITTVMVVAVAKVHLPKGVWNSDGGYELNLVYVVAAFALAGIGAGQWSLDNALNLDLAGTGWALAELGAGILAGLGALAGPALEARLGRRSEPSSARTSSP
jgi:putative oxidoreductase